MTNVADLINGSTVVMFSWVKCPFCVRAKALLGPLTTDMKVYEIDTMEGGDDMKAQIERDYNHDTVPAIFIKGIFVGGCSDVQALNSEGKLVPMLSAN